MDRLEKANKYIELNKNKVNDRFKPTYHVTPLIGWLNDPNGFSMFNGEYHLFFQYHPYSATWGPMHWGHAKSKDLIKWEQLPVAIAPKGEGPEDGAAFSGSAIEDNGLHIIMYTEVYPGKQVQCIKVSSDGINYQALPENPVITSDLIPNKEKYVIADFRDPKLWKKDGIYYCVIGIREKKNMSGAVILFQSKDLTTWEYVNVISRSNNTMGKMWECPDIFKLNKRDVFIVSPQFYKTDNYDYENVHSTIYFTGDFDYKKGVFKHNGSTELDNGFDFYAAQTLLDNQQRRIMIAWMDMWERNYPTDHLGHHWTGALTLPRELKIVDGKLTQMPVEEIKQYRHNQVDIESELVGSKQFKGIKGDAIELEVLVNLKESQTFSIDLFKSDSNQTTLTYNKENQYFTFDRRESGIELVGNNNHETNSGIRRKKICLSNNTLKLNIFLDKSSIEVFINDGETVMTSRVYPEGDDIEFYADDTVSLQIKKWSIII